MMFRKIAKLLAYFCVLFLVLAVVAAFISHTAWFREKVRQRIVAAVEQASGGRVELGEFAYNWHTLTATFQNFVVHGTEPASAPPLFRAASVRVELRILSVFERKVAVSSIFIERPDIYVLVRKDGSTNIPTPDLREKSPDTTIQDLLNLKLRHFELRNGSFRTDLEQIPLNARGDETAVTLTYSRRAPSYLAKITCKQFYLNSTSFQPIAMSVSAQARLEKNRLLLESSNLVSGSSTIRASGSLRDFTQPLLDVQLNTDLAGADLARIAGISQLRDGRVQFNGALHRDPNNAFELAGVLNGQKLAIQANGYTLKDCNLASRISASAGRLSLSKFRFTLPWAQLNGDATLFHNRGFSLEGHLAALNVTEAERFFSKKQVAWPALASGSIRVSGLLGKSPHDFLAEAKLDITPVSSATPLSGHIEAVYRQAGNSVDVTNSQLNLPHTRLALSGRVNENLRAVLDSENLDDFSVLQQFLNTRFSSAQFPKLLSNGSAHFDGAVAGALDRPRITGSVLLNHFAEFGGTWDRLQTQVDVSAESATLTDLSLDQTPMHVSGSAHVQLTNWGLSPNAPASIQMQFRKLGVSRAFELIHLSNVPFSGGIISGSVNLQGSLHDPEGTMQIRAADTRAFDQHIDSAVADLQVRPGELRIRNGRVETGSASVNLSGSYVHEPGSWSDGQLEIKADSNAFPLTAISLARKYEPSWNGEVELHADAGLRITSGHIEPTLANGTFVLRGITENSESIGDVTLDASTKDDYLYAGFSGRLRDSNVKGNAEIHLVPGSPAKGQVQIDRIGLRTLYGLINRGESLPFDGGLRGAATFSGPLLQPERMQASIRIEDLEASATGLLREVVTPNTPDLIFRNSGPILLEAAAGQLTIRSFQLAGRDTNLNLKGSISYLRQTSFDLNAEGGLDLRMLQLFEPNVQSSGRGVISANIRGTPVAPVVTGTLDIQNGSFSANGFPNGLTAVNGSLRFDRNRATIQTLTGHTGGGTLAFGGFVDFSAGGPLIYRLDATAQDVRVRYANSISVTANSQLRLTGTSKSSVLSGTTTVSRVVFTPNADVATLLAVAAAPVATPAKQNDFVSGLQFDVHIESASDLQVTTELSRDVQAEIDLRLRGTPEHPVLLGNIVANQGDVKVFGGKYSINRGEIRFVNAARIEPVLDLDLQTEAHGISVDITVAGTLGKLNVNYRSDPPLQPRDIIALLAVGRAPETTINSNVQTTTDTSAMQYGANTVLGQAISPVSNRLSKLFGITNIKIDPLVQSTTFAPQARLTLEQQISREITVTYVTNLSQTSEQIFRLEWAFSPQYSVVALRDDNGEFGIDIQYRKRFK